MALLLSANAAPDRANSDSYGPAYLRASSGDSVRYRSASNDVVWPTEGCDGEASKKFHSRLGNSTKKATPARRGKAPA